MTPPVRLFHSTVTSCTATENARVPSAKNAPPSLEVGMATTIDTTSAMSEAATRESQKLHPSRASRMTLA